MIPAEAVEAAASVHCNRGESYWGDWTEEAKAEALDDMRAALEAAAPHMRSSRERSFDIIPTEPDDGLLDWVLGGKP